MFGKNARMTALHARKQLLIVESELNRAQLAGDIAAIKKSAGVLTHRAKSFTAIGSVVGAVIAGVRVFMRHRAKAAAVPKPSALRTILKGAGLVSSLWMASRERFRRGERPDPG